MDDESIREYHTALCFAVSDANTFLTSDWDMPNCRAICDGLIPALVAARTALTCPRVNEDFMTSACPLSLDGDCFWTDASFAVGHALGGNLPRRFASWTDVVMSRSSSASVRYLTALGRSGEDMALRSSVGGCVLGRGPPCRRGAILYRMGREKVGCCWLSAITLHAAIMPPPAAASNLDP
jgi:hypothetical protein